MAPVLSAALFGLAFGALSAGPLTDRFGRRAVLTSSVLVCLASAFSGGLAQLFCETPEHEADHGKTHEGRRLAGLPLVVTSQPPVAADPGRRPLDNPTLRKHHEAVLVATAHNLGRPCADPGHSGFHLAALIHMCDRIARSALEALDGNLAPPRPVSATGQHVPQADPAFPYYPNERLHAFL